MVEDNKDTRQKGRNEHLSAGEPSHHRVFFPGVPLSVSALLDAAAGVTGAAAQIKHT